MTAHSSCKHSQHLRNNRPIENSFKDQVSFVGAPQPLVGVITEGYNSEEFFSVFLGEI
jgi:hypothetical protein